MRYKSILVAESIPSSLLPYYRVRQPIVDVLKPIRLDGITATVSSPENALDNFTVLLSIPLIGANTAAAHYTVDSDAISLQTGGTLPSLMVTAMTKHSPNAEKEFSEVIGVGRLGLFVDIRVQNTSYPIGAFGCRINIILKYTIL